MKELNEKLSKLNQEVGALNFQITKAREQLQKARDEKDSKAWEIEFDTLTSLKEKKRTLEKAIDILNKADMIVLGIEGWEER